MTETTNEIFLAFYQESYCFQDIEQFLDNRYFLLSVIPT